MSVQDSLLSETIRRQYDKTPYPRMPIETSPKDDSTSLFTHAIQTPYYLRDQRVIDTHECVILDAGCGSGYKALSLAIANPGAKVVGIDFSPESVNVARHRLSYHGIHTAEFHTLSIYDLPTLGMTFDYINCDDVLTLLPDRPAALQVMRSVLNPDGIIRINLHSRYQRHRYYRGQDIFKDMGLFDDSPGAAEVEIVREFMQVLKPAVDLRRFGWGEKFETSKTAEQAILMNYLLSGDQGFTIPEAFDLMRSAGLELVSMMHWQQWDIFRLLQDPEHLPAVWQSCLSNTSDEHRFHLFERLHPSNRLIDFWCGNPKSRPTPPSIEDWDNDTWARSRVHLHPYIKTDTIYQRLVNSVEYSAPVAITYKPFEIDMLIDSSFASLFLALWDGSRSLTELVEHYCMLYPIDPVTLAPCDRAQVASLIKTFLKKQAAYTVFLIEPAIA